MMTNYNSESSGKWIYFQICKDSVYFPKNLSEKKLLKDYYSKKEKKILLEVIGAQSKDEEKLMK